jgi:hypothetical protein
MVVDEIKEPHACDSSSCNVTMGNTSLPLSTGSTCWSKHAVATDLSAYGKESEGGIHASASDAKKSKVDEC